jgi:hypothetical protein
MINQEIDREPVREHDRLQPSGMPRPEPRAPPPGSNCSPAT